MVDAPGHRAPARSSRPAAGERCARAHAPHDETPRAQAGAAHLCAPARGAFDAFGKEYNTERPHEAWKQETPASHHRHSPRPYPNRLPTLKSPLHFLVKRVTDAGTFRFQKTLLYIANSLVDQHIGLDETDDGVWSIYFNTMLLATVDERDDIIRG